MKQLFSLVICSFIAASVYAQERNQADVSIANVTLASTAVNNAVATAKGNRSIPVGQGSPNANVNRLAVTKTIRCTITIHNENDDDAYGTVIVAVLPVEVSVTNISSTGTVHKSTPNSPFAGYITFDIGRMSVGQNIQVEFTFTKSKYGNKVGTYAYSGTPDPNPANNYKDATF